LTMNQTTTNPSTDEIKDELFSFFLHEFEDKFMGGETCKEHEGNCVCAITEFLSEKVPTLLSRKEEEVRKELRELIKSFRIPEVQRAGRSKMFRPDFAIDSYNRAISDLEAALNL
jgi:hypothetical protein